MSKVTADKQECVKEGHKWVDHNRLARYRVYSICERCGAVQKLEWQTTGFERL